MFFRVFDKDGVKIREGITNLTPKRLTNLPPGCVIHLRNNDGTWVAVRAMEMKVNTEKKDNEQTNQT